MLPICLTLTNRYQKKLHSAITVASDDKKDRKNRGEEEFKTARPKAKELPDDLVKRNRNLFGNLLGHLNKAKTILENEKDKVIFD